MPPASIIRKECAIEVLAKTAGGGKIRINTASFDRDDDRVYPSGAQIENYLANPVVQWGHNYKDPWATIGRTIKMELSDGAIDVEFEFRPAANEHDPQNIILLLWEGGWVRTSSIGFKPLTYKQNAKGYDFTTWELLEWSLVPIPSNQDALRLAVKGLDALIGEEDLPGLEAEAKDIEAEVIKEISLDRLVDEVCSAIYRTLWRDQDYDGVRRCIVAVYAAYAVVGVGVAYYRADYTISDGGIIIVAPRDTWPEVEQSWGELSVTLETIGRSWSAKAGARHSAKDIESIQSIHDMAVGLGAACETASAGEDTDEEKSKGVVDDGEGDTQIDVAEQASINDLETAITNLRSVLGR